MLRSPPWRQAPKEPSLYRMRSIGLVTAFVNCSGVGNRSVAYLSSNSVGGLYTMSLGQVYFRRGPYAARINIQSVRSLKAAYLLQMARTQDARLKG